MSNPTNPGRGRRQLLLIVGLFIAPVIAAFVLSFSGWRPEGTRQAGILIEPPRDFKSVVATKPDGSTTFWNRPEGHWYLLWPVPADCGQPCVDMADTLKRVRLRMARHAPRLEVYLVGEPDAALTAALAESPIQRVTLAPNPLPPAIAPSAPGAAGQAGLPLALHLVDPNGYWVMDYPAGTDPTGLRKDLDRLIN
jgi:hypothetical protein